MSTNHPNGAERIREAIEEAEEISDLLIDPFEVLVELTPTRPDAPFTPVMLKSLAAMQRAFPLAYETLREKLKKAGCRIRELDAAIADITGISPGRTSQVDILIRLSRNADLFHTADGAGYADVHTDGHRETWPIKSKGFRLWLTCRFFAETRGAPSSEAQQTALNAIEAQALFAGPKRTVCLRVGGYGGKVYLDLCDEAWQAVEIDDKGWRVVQDPPIRFRRTAGMLPLPVPAGGGSIETLRSFLNVKSDADFVLAAAWLLGCLSDRGPYPALGLSGEQGSAKSSFARILKDLVDPHTVSLRSLSRDERDLFIAGNNGYVLAFDNVSTIPAGMSDTLCRLATGGGFSTRKLHTDQDEVLIDVTRPTILNGIEDFFARADLADRAILLTLEAIPEERRRTEADLWAAFEAERPKILATLLDGVAKGLAKLPETKLDKHPRMADFAKWVTACETAFWPAGTFLKAYTGNRDVAVETTIDSDPVAGVVCTFMLTRTEWVGTASELLDELGKTAGERITKSKSWPQMSNLLSGRLRRAAPVLRKVGIELNFDREGKGRRRNIYILKDAKTANDFGADGERTMEADGAPKEDASTVRKSPLKNNKETEADDADAKSPSFSGCEDEGWSAEL